MTLHGLQVGSVHTDFPGPIIPPVQPVPPKPPVQYAYPEQIMEARVTRGLSQRQEPTPPPES